MDTAQLEQQLRGSASNGEWVALLARYFSAHELCYGHGTDNPADEAYWLLRHLQGWRQAVWDREADPDLAHTAAELARRRVSERIPLAYLLNEAWFAGLEFFVDERVLVPRSPCAEIIERCFAPWCELQPRDRVLDIGTGSGCIAIAIACHCEDVSVDATDTSEEALEVARQNAEFHGVASRVWLQRADLFPRRTDAYRVIISNPPYVSEADYAELPEEYRHEPREGLIGGRTGLEPTLRLLAGASDYLAPDGVIVVEVGRGAEALDSLLPGLALVWVELERGGEGVFVLSAQDLMKYLRDNVLPLTPSI